jgi:hypothetical protein
MFIILIISFASIAANKLLNTDEGLRKFTHTLKDGESIEIKSYFIDTDEDLIVEKSLPNLNTAILRSFETETNSVKDITTYITHISKSRSIGYWLITPEFTVSDPTYAFYTNNKGYDWNKINGLSNYYHSLFKNKTTRTFLFNQALDYTSIQCLKYPSDFKKNILKELDILLNFTNSLNNINSKINTDNIKDYWKGFIYRRYAIDKVPISEIQSAIIKSQMKIKSIDTSKQPNNMYEFNINNQLTLFISSENYSLHSKKNFKKIIFNHNVSIEKIKYLKDDTGEYYQLTGLENGENINYLYNKNLDKID